MESLKERLLEMAAFHEQSITSIVSRDEIALLREASEALGVSPPGILITPLPSQRAHNPSAAPTPKVRHVCATCRREFPEQAEDPVPAQPVLKPIPTEWADAANAARGLCESEANRWETASPTTSEHWRTVALHLGALYLTQDHLQASSGVSPSGGWQQEQCICAAIRLPNGEVWRGHRHDDAIRVAARAPEVTNGDIRDAEQGFITSRNRFVGRKEGAAIQRAAGIASADTLKPVGETLFSEDLYLRDWRSAPPASPSLPHAGSGEPERSER